jgi:hypothetical protein
MTTTTQDRPRNERRARGPAKGPEGLASALRVEVQLWVAVLFMAIAFGAGVLVHAMAAPQPSSPPVVSTVGDGGATGGVFAPPLSDDQVSAGLPAGHPDIAGGSEQTDDGNDGKAGKGAEDEAAQEGSSP